MTVGEAGQDRTGARPLTRQGRIGMRSWAGTCDADLAWANTHTGRLLIDTSSHPPGPSTYVCGAL